MSRKRRSRRKRHERPRMTEDGRILVMTSIEATLAQMPKYDAYSVGHGVHGDTRYNRRKEKRDFRRQLNEEL